MKKILYQALVVAIAFTFIGCSKSSSSPQPVSVLVEGTVYPTVVIGSQTWTSLNYNGPGGENYNNSTTNIPLFGKLYTLEEARAIPLPKGWELPTAADYNLLLKNAGGVPQTRDVNGVTVISSNYMVGSFSAVELMSTSRWQGTNGNNQLGFNAQPAGDGAADTQNFYSLYSSAFFIVNDFTANNSHYLAVQISCSPPQAAISDYDLGIDFRGSVRFVKNN